MAMQEIKIPVCPSIAKMVGAKEQDHFVLFDTPAEMASYAEATTPQTSSYRNRQSSSWNANQEFSATVRMTVNGDLSSVEASDKLLAKMEKNELASGRKAWRDDVCGSIPNVPAFIAGHPMAMRRRVRDDSAFAPIAIIADLSSGGGIDAEKVRKRGIAILALARAMAMRRPIELWAISGSENVAGKKGAIWTGCRIETAPLDLSSAAHTLTHPAVPRNLFYALHSNNGSAVRTPYMLMRAEQPHLAEIMAPAFPHVSDLLCLPSLSLGHKSITDPDAWIAEKLADYAPAGTA